MRSNSAQRVLFDTLEARRLCAITPAHLALWQRSVAEVTPATNLYSNGSPTVTWAGINNQTVTTVTADCTTYVTVLLKQAYKFSNTDFINLFGVSSPSLTRYYDQAVADGALDGFKQIADVKPGDLFISKYPEGSSARGHMVAIETAPVLQYTNSTLRAYNVTILDVTGSPHSNDTRNNANPDGSDDSGAGRGNIRLYTDLDGNLTHWAWGTSASSVPYDPVEKPVIFARVPALSIKSPSALKATAVGERTVNLTWLDNSTIEDGYVIQRSGDNGATWTAVGDVNAGGTSFTDDTAQPGTFRYRVYAVAGSSQSGNSAAATVTLTAVVPVAPTGLTATLSGVNVRVSWQDNAATETSYVLERSVNGGAFGLLVTLGANATSFTDATAYTNNIYTYRVHANGDFADSATLSGEYDGRVRSPVVVTPGITKPVTVTGGTGTTATTTTVTTPSRVTKPPAKGAIVTSITDSVLAITPLSILD